MPRLHPSRAPSPPARRSFHLPFTGRRNSYRSADREPADPPPCGTSRHSRGGESDCNDELEFRDKNNNNNNYNLTTKSTQPETIEPAGTMESMTYSIEAKPTRATFAETFSSGGDGEEEDYLVRQHRSSTTFSSGDDRPQELLQQHEHQVSKSSSYEDSYLNGEDSTSYSSGEEFINLAQEAARIPSRHYRPPTTAKMVGHPTQYEGYNSRSYNNQEYHHHHHEGLEEEKFEEEEQTYYEDHHGQAEYAGEQYDEIQFVDSETDQVFTFGTQGGEDYINGTNPQQAAAVVAPSYDDYHHGSHNVASYDYTSRHARTTPIQQNPSFGGTSMEYDTCSKTLNSNLETLHTDLQGVNYIPTGNGHDAVHDPAFHHHRHYDGESYDDDDNDEERIGGGQYYNNAHHLHHHTGTHINQSASYMYEDDGYIHYQDGEEEYYEDDTRFEQDTNLDTVTEFTKDLTSHAAETRDGDHTEVISQLMDSYLSDRSSNSSWDEGSFASPTRNRSRIDSYDGTEYTDDEESVSRRKGGTRTFMDIINSFRDMNTRDDSYDEDDDDRDDADEFEDEHEGRKKKKKSRRRSRRQSKKGDLETILGNIGTTATELLNETIDQMNKGSKKSSRRRSGNRGRRRRQDDQAEHIMDSISSIFSCGAPKHYY